MNAKEFYKKQLQENDAAVARVMLRAYLCGYYHEKTVPEIEEIAREIEKSEKKERVVPGKYDLLFQEYLECVEFSIDKTTNEDGEPCYCLIDEQHANLGDIENDRFKNAREIFDRMNVYIDHYFLRDLDEEWGAYGMPGEAPETLDEWDKHSKENDGTEFVSCHKFDFDVIDMILHHADEIDLEKVVEMGV